MQERQTQVLALPARAEGIGRDTEGILRKRCHSRGLPSLTAEIHSIPRNSRQFHTGRINPCQKCEVHRGRGSKPCSRFSHSDGLKSVSLMWAPSLSCFYPCSFSLTPAFLKCGNVIPWSKGGGESSFFSLSLPKLPSPQMILVNPSFPSSPHTYTLYSLTTLHPPSASLHGIPHLSSPSTSLLLQACSLMSALMSLQFFIGNPLSCFQILSLSTPK